MRQIDIQNTMCLVGYNDVMQLNRQKEDTYFFIKGISILFYDFLKCVYFINSKAIKRF